MITQLADRAAVLSDVLPKNIKTKTISTGNGDLDSGIQIFINSKSIRSIYDIKYQTNVINGLLVESAMIIYSSSM